MAGTIAPLTIRLLGPLEVLVDRRPIVVDTRKALAILALVAAEGRPFARDELAAMFWPEADDEAARGALRRTLSALRSAVGPAGLDIGRSQVALDSGGASVDLVAFERLSVSESSDDLEAAAALARGPFLAGFALRDSPDFDDWQAARAARVERAVAALLDRLASDRLATGDVAGAVATAARRVELDPLDELGQRRLIELLATSGDRTGAIRRYRELVAVFDRELGVSPLRETTELYDAIREDRFERDVTTRATSSVPAVTSPPAGHATIPLIGRDAEVAAIEAAWRGSAPDGRLVLIEGEAGIGKTRLAEAAAATVRERGGVVLAARGYPGEGAIAYAPIAGLLRAGLALPGAEARLATLDPTIRLDLGRLVDLPAGMRIGGSNPGALPADGPGARVRLLDAIGSALTGLASGPVPGLVWIDDLHLADEATREALAYLARRLTGRPLLLMLAWRREDLDSGGEATADDLGRLAIATSIVLGRLSRDEVAGIVHAARPTDAADADLVDALLADSEGLPLHVIAALESGDPPGTMPRGVQALLRERLASVSETAAQVIAAAAVIGRSFDFVTLRAAGGRSDDETIDALEESMRRGIVREIPGGGPSLAYDFVHGRMRDVAYESISLGRRRLLHRRVADAIRHQPTAAGRDDLSRYARIAVHEREAGRPAEAAAAFMDAASRAEAVYANREAIDHLEAALALGQAGEASVQARIGELRARIGDYPGAIAALETAAALAERGDLPDIEIALGRAHRRRGDLDAAASHLESALATPDLPDAVRTRALVERSVIALRAGDLGVADASASAARDLADRVGDPHLAGVAARIVGLVANARGDRVRARAALERSVVLAADDPDPTASIAAMTALALTLAGDGAIDDALALGADAAEACRHIGDRHLEAAVENHLADMLHEAGRDDLAMEHLKRAVALFADIGEGAGVAVAAEPDPGIWTLAAW